MDYICDGVTDCEDNDDEAQCNRKRDDFDSDSELGILIVGNPISWKFQFGTIKLKSVQL